MFAGSIRFNLDPFGNFSDEILWDTLEIVSLCCFFKASGQNRLKPQAYQKLKFYKVFLSKVNLKETLEKMKNGLDMCIHSGGTNLSIGQKQLICLARVILKKSKILIIDEATASIDQR